jgi:hypothetical protein
MLLIDLPPARSLLADEEREDGIRQVEDTEHTYGFNRQVDAENSRQVLVKDSRRPNEESKRRFIMTFKFKCFNSTGS